MAPAQKRKRTDGDDKARDAGSPLAVKKQKLLSARKQLPIWSKADTIRSALKHTNVLVLAGETGSGKSTQVPQFLLQSPWCTGKIAVTQPRRVAAISLARRVAEEMGSPLGASSPASKVGYSVRFDDNTSPSTRIKYLTEGMLLQEMLRDPTLGQYSCVIVDEVHERSVDVDLILGFLKGLLEGKGKREKPLKVVVMSATADVESLRSFFSSHDDERQMEGQPSNDGTTNGDVPSSQEADVSLCHVEGRQYPVKLQYLDRPTEDLIDTARTRILQIHCKEPMPGDILVFLTGQDTITGLQKSLEDFAQSLTAEFPKLLVLPLYAALPQAAQQRIFERAPPNTRKVILSTNIAETSVTVPGVRFVVDTGKAKIKQFRPKIGIESLLVKPISQSSADQRKGRAGREAPGQCFRLYPEAEYQALEKNAKPEILHCDLSAALLKMKARGIDDVVNFPYLTRPTDTAMIISLNILGQLGCIDIVKGHITEIGRKVARLPLTPTLGRVILESTRPDRDCLLEVIDIVAALDVESIWLPTPTEELHEKAVEARAQLISRRGDHLTLLNAVRAYAEESSDRKRWSTDHHISHRSMQTVMDVRKQLLIQTKSLSPTSPTSRSTIDEQTQDNIFKCFLRGCGVSNIAVLRPDKSYVSLGKQTIAIHPTSLLFQKKVEGIMYQDCTFTTKLFARRVSAIQLAWLDELGHLV